MTKVPGTLLTDETIPTISPRQTWHERPIIFDCEGDRLIGIATIPDTPIETGVVIVVGGPQYRAGSHRQFTLLARELANSGIASFRFDYRGMGDSEGDRRSFEFIEADIHASISTFCGAIPEVSKIVLWGLCDAASAVLMYGHTDPRVRGLILLNPWVHTEVATTKVLLKHYYIARLFSKSFWTKLGRGEVSLTRTLKDLKSYISHVVGGKHWFEKSSINARLQSQHFIERMCAGLMSFSSEVLIILSGNDMTAREFEYMIKSDKQWSKAIACARISCKRIEDSDHTFSRQEWKRLVEKDTAYWVRQCV